MRICVGPDTQYCGQNEESAPTIHSFKNIDEFVFSRDMRTEGLSFKTKRRRELTLQKYTTKYTILKDLLYADFLEKWQILGPASKSFFPDFQQVVPSTCI